MFTFEKHRLRARGSRYFTMTSTQSSDARYPSLGHHGMCNSSLMRYDLSTIHDEVP